MLTLTIVAGSLCATTVLVQVASWAASWLGRDFVWRDTPMRIADRGRNA